VDDGAGRPSGLDQPRRHWPLALALRLHIGEEQAEGEWSASTYRTAPGIDTSDAGSSRPADEQQKQTCPSLRTVRCKCFDSPPLSIESIKVLDVKLLPE
jgi:hypothetical protein